MGASTVAAIATARGEAALAIVRMSGPRAFEIGSRVFSGKDLKAVETHTAWFGRAVDGDGRVLDEVVTTIFRGPRSSTGEDVVEFTCHGGLAAPQAVLNACFEAGAIPAEPGEFSRRAFLNGKLRLDEAEAVIDLIHSRSEAAHRASMRQLQGRFRERLRALRDDLLRLCGLVELELDFGEEDVEFADRVQIRALVATLTGVLEELLSAGQTSRYWREGVRVVIAGRPNAGKSTLVNAILGSDRVIVSEVPGTTRDFVEAEFELDGVLLKLTDTAGLRSSDDAIEAEGVRRSTERVREADLVVYVFDGCVGLAVEEIEYVESLGNAAVITVANKADLLHGDRDGDADVVMSAERARAGDEDLEPLMSAIREGLPDGVLDFDSADGMVNARHVSHLREAREAVTAAGRMIEEGAGGELLSLELRSALRALGAITGEITNEDILSEIFSRFCIGK